jgi:hypothetical protein
MRLGLVLALCLVSAALGAGIDHYWANLGSLLSTKESAAVQTPPPPSEQNKAEVLGDRVRCDVRFGELHLPDTEYRSFFDRCMGTPPRAEQDAQ